MYEIFTYGRFEVEPENEHAFVEAWSEFAEWISRHAGNRSIRLMRDLRNTGRLVSVGKWEDAEAVRAFKSAPEFKEQLGRIVKLAKDFEPTELVTLVKAEGGTLERLSPPDGLEPIHAPT
ncbi:MAG: antibiotic biosynthesis monooxygenase family protein [Gaiellaceae bacterium]